MTPRIRYRLPEGAPAPPDRGQTMLPNGSFEMRVEDPTTALHDLTGWAIERGISFDTIEVTRPSLEDVYIELTGGEVGRE